MPFVPLYVRRFATRAFKSLNDLTAPDRGGEDVVSICIPHAEQYEHSGMDDDSTESTSSSERSTKEAVSGEGDSGSTSVTQESPEEVVEAAELEQLRPPQPAMSRLLSLKDLQQSQSVACVHLKVHMFCYGRVSCLFICYSVVCIDTG